MDNPICVCADRNPFSTAEELVETIAQTGFSGVEWFESNHEDRWSAPETAARLRTLVRRYELVSQYHAPYEELFDLACEDGKLRRPKSVVRVVAEVLDKAERLGARLTTLHLGNCPPGVDRAEALNCVAEGLLLAVEQLEHRHIRLALENHTAAVLQSPLGDRPEELDWMMEQLSSPWIGRTLDVGHAHINGHMEDFLARPFERIFNAHLHDNAGAKDDHLPLGMGTVPWDRVLHRLAVECYKGPVTLEFFCPPEDYLRSIAIIRRAN